MALEALRRLVEPLQALAQPRSVASDRVSSSIPSLRLRFMRQEDLPGGVPPRFPWRRASSCSRIHFQ